MINTTFTTISIDRENIKWENHIKDLSPVELHNGTYFKREDKFAPLGFGNINGSKLRVCIWLIDQAIKKGAQGVIHGAVSGSPQHPMVATICKHYNIPCVDVIGVKDITGHKNLEIAKEMGATFEFSNVGYAKTLESKAYQLRDSKYPNYFVLETNITVNEGRNTPGRIQQFHAVGAYQVANIPTHIERIVLPAGSCNSCVGALYGLSIRRPKNLKEIVLCGIGNFGSKDPEYIQRRLQLIGAPDVYNWPWDNGAGLFGLTDNENKIVVRHLDIYTHPETGKPYTTYNDLMPFNYDGIELHGRYEGKIFNWLKDNNQMHLLDNKTMFWIVGSEPR